MRPTSLLLLVLTPLGLAACGSTVAQPSRTSTPSTSTLAYRDPTFHFSFRYPRNWRIPTAGGRESTVQGVRTYILAVNAPGNAARIEVTVDRNIIPFPQFQEGHVAADPSGGPDTFHYHHLTVSGWPSMGIQRYNGAQIDGLFTITNTRTYSYQVRMVTGTPPFPSSSVGGYNTIVRTLKVPFS